MLEIIAAGALGAVSHAKSKDFVRRRLRFTDLVERPGLGLFTGAVTMVVTGVAVAALPFVGAGAGLVVGIGAGLGVGTGVGKGVRQARGGWHPDD